MPPANTSQACSGCRVLVYKDLCQRWHRCSECGTHLCRDHNAGLNIQALGKKEPRAGQTPLEARALAH